MATARRQRTPDATREARSYREWKSTGSSQDTVQDAAQPDRTVEPEAFAMGQPLSERGRAQAATESKLLDSSDTAKFWRQLGTDQPGIGGFVSPDDARLQVVG